MGDIMRPIPFGELLKRMFEEYADDRAIFALPESSFFQKQNQRQAAIFGERCDTPLGPAAGPHTQLAQNIAAAYLAGSRFIELKTVQEHEPPVAKPCIDAEDEGFNTEWSSEYPVEKACDEYVKAWALLHLLEEVFQLRATDAASFIFNMSIGYNLQGITSPRLDRYIDSLMDASGHPAFRKAQAELTAFIEDGALLRAAGLAHRLPDLRGLAERISPQICRSATLSTMHGCPPDEIEKICAHLLSKKKLSTYVKLNPTLLSYPVVRSLLDALGFDYVELSEAAFAHDLQYSDAVPMLKRLAALAAGAGRRFGVKLTNTLGAVNFKGKLPGGEMYMSGRALFPLSISLAAKICREFDGELPVSFSAGINEHNAADVFAAGIRPITLATELLKPGGYSRLPAIAAKLENTPGWDKQKIDVGLVAALAEKALTADYTQKEYRGREKAALSGALPLFDCAEAPCKAACPIRQDIPEYIRLVGEKRYAEALALIYETNALPSITGHICDHACQYRCSRLDYEGCVLIREVKRIAVAHGMDEYRRRWLAPVQKRPVKVAVLGAGPAGLASAYFLAREGFPVTVFEPRESAGGTVRHVIPRFRISAEAIDSDIGFIREHGVEFVFRSDPGLTPATLRSQGFAYVVVAVGTGAERPFPLAGRGSGKGPRILPALEFLAQFGRDPSALRLGRRIAVLGAGNTAMDAARAALRLPGVETASVLYRRTEREMPAYREEYKLALQDNVAFHFLRNPEEITADGELLCRIMKLGEPDESGRRAPEPTGDFQRFAFDTLITAIGEDVDQALLQRLEVAGREPAAGDRRIFLAGDAHTGPSSIVRCIADGRAAADAICRAEDPAWSRNPVTFPGATAGRAAEIARKKLGLTRPPQSPAEGSAFPDPAVGDREFGRCLECNSVCNKCVEVCPNRANVALPVDSAGLRNFYQIVHLDACCNECGNCATFCPWEGQPYAGKITLFSRGDDFAASANPGFWLSGNRLHVRRAGEVRVFDLRDGRWDAPAADPDLAPMAEIFNLLRAGRPSLFGPVEE